MPKNLTLAVAQARTLATTPETLADLSRISRSAAQRHADLLLFPEAYLGGYPRGATFGAAIGSRTAEGREQFLQYFNSAVDLGDTPQGAGDDWVERRLPVPSALSRSDSTTTSTANVAHRGDGTREHLEHVARETGVFLVVGLVERAGGSLYCAVVYVCPRRGCIGKRRKVMPTGTERVVWAQGGAETLKAVVGEFRNGTIKVPLAAAICWENYMPLLRQSLYAQNIGIYLAPTADARDSWLSLMRTVGIEGRCWVVTGCQCVRKKQLPQWVAGKQNTSVGDEPSSQMEEHGEKAMSKIWSADDAEMQQIPALRSQDSEKNASSVIDETSPSRPVRRRSSIITETPDHHEICWPAPDGTAAAVDSISPASTSPTREKKPRRTSVITETADKHEICWPINEVQENGEMLNGTEGDEFVSRGGSCIVSPMGDVVAGPVWEADEELVVATVDMDDCIRGRLDLDVAGSYSRSDAFKLTVEGLDTNPPPL